MALDICSGSRGEKGENKEGERAKESIVRIQSPAAFFYTSLWLLSWSQVAKHQRGHGMAPVRSLTGLDPAIRFQQF